MVNISFVPRKHKYEVKTCGDCGAEYRPQDDLDTKMCPFCQKECEK